MHEDVLHCLRDCPLSACIWRSLGYNGIAFFQELNTHVWLKKGLRLSDPLIFVAGIWCIWKARNAMCLGNEHVNYHQLRHNVGSYLSSLSTSLGEGLVSRSQQRWTSWHPSRMQAIILNVDGSSFGNPGRSGFGGVLRTSDGTWLCGFSGFFGISNNLHVELLAIMHGLKLTWEKGHRNVICYSDSLHAINLIQAPLNAWHVYATIIRNVKDLLNLPWNVQLTHTLREANACADFLAKHGAIHDSSWCILENPIPGLEDLLLADASRVQFLRL